MKCPCCGKDFQFEYGENCCGITTYSTCSYPLDDIIIALDLEKRRLEAWKNKMEDWIPILKKAELAKEEADQAMREVK